MVFKLVRADNVDACKIELPAGQHAFGRGVFLDCNDKRVSRRHGELEVSADSVILKALHQNPCFYKRKGSEDISILKIGTTVELCNGDKFGLLPADFWYELLLCNYDTEPLDNGNGVSNGMSTTNGDGDCENENGDEMVNFEMDETVRDAQTSQSILAPEVAMEEPEQSNPSSDQSTQGPDEGLNPEPVAGQPIKRPPDEEEPGTSQKRVKTEPEGSADEMEASSSNVNIKTSPQPSPAKPTATPSRERCMYGEQCYRRNPAHKAQFSHPSDPDWGAGARGSCPWGRNCRRRDPRHWRDNEHPPGVAPPSRAPGDKGSSSDDMSPATRPAKKVKRKRKTPDSDDSFVTDGSGEEVGSESETAVEELPRKRVRKTVKRDWVEDSDQEDPYKTDGSEDEWVPSTASHSEDI